MLRLLWFVFCVVNLLAGAVMLLAGVQVRNAILFFGGLLVVLVFWKIIEDMFHNQIPPWQSGYRR